jgi:hypothetical protein
MKGLLFVVFVLIINSIIQCQPTFRRTVYRITPPLAVVGVGKLLAYSKMYQNHRELEFVLKRMQEQKLKNEALLETKENDNIKKVENPNEKEIRKDNAVPR